LCILFTIFRRDFKHYCNNIEQIDIKFAWEQYVQLGGHGEIMFYLNKKNYNIG